MSELSSRKPLGTEQRFILLFALYYFLKLFFFAATLPPGSATDEVVHLQVIRLYAESTSLFPFNGSFETYSRPLPEFARFTSLTEFPYLYHFVFGKLCAFLHLDPWEFSTIVTLRFINVLFAAATFVLFLKILRILTDDPITRIAAVAVYTNLFMFTVISSGVTYDNLSNLLAAVSIFAFLQLYSRFSARNVLVLSGSLLIGALVKLSIFPLAFALITTLAVIAVRRRTEFFQAISMRELRTQPILLSITFFSALLVAELFGGNIAQYGKLLPSCAEIFSQTECLQNGFESDAAEGLRRLEAHEPPSSDRGSGTEILPLGEYSLFWLDKMIERTIGAYTHIGISHPKELIESIRWMVIAALALTVIYWPKMSPDAKPAFLACALYLFVVFWFFNYGPHRTFGFARLGINGRYAFPVLTILTSWFAIALLLPFRGPRRAFAALCVSGVFFFAELPYLSTQKVFYDFISPHRLTYYTSMPYYPNPVYDLHNRLIKDYAGPKSSNY